MKTRPPGGLSETLEGHEKDPKWRFISAITDYCGEQNHQNMVAMSCAVGQLYSTLRGGDFGEGQPKISRNIKNILDDIFTEFDWVEAKDSGISKHLAISIETLSGNVRDGNPADFAKNIIALFGITIGDGNALIRGKMTPRSIELRDATLKPRKHQSESLSLGLRGKERVLGVLDNSLSSRVKKKESKQEKGIREAEQIIQDFLGMVWAIPYHIPGKINNYLRLDFELSSLEVRLSEITSLINRRKELRELISQTKQRVKSLRESSSMDKRKGKRAQRVEFLLSVRQSEFIGIPIKKLQIQKSGLLKKRRKVRKKMKEIASGLRYTEASLQQELFQKLSIASEVANKDVRHIISVTELRVAYLSVFRQAASHLSEHWNYVEDVATGEETMQTRFGAKKMRFEMNQLVGHMAISLRKKNPSRKIYSHKKKVK